MAEPLPDDLHELLAFEDPDEQRTWVFDLTFLMSRWTCIYGNGCQGVLTAPAAELAHGCCSYGAHFTSDEDRATVSKYAARLTKDDWQLLDVARRRGSYELKARDGTWKTRLVDGACIFLNRPGWKNGPGCALHQAAVDAGERPMDWKPDVCWQLPLRQVDSTDEHGHVTSFVREWKRRDWGEGGSEFHWWCTADPEAFVGSQPVYIALHDELVEMVGSKVYDLMVKSLQAREAAASKDHRAAVRRQSRGLAPAPGTGVVYLPHPAVRR